MKEKLRKKIRALVKRLHHAESAHDRAYYARAGASAELEASHSAQAELMALSVQAAMEARDGGSSVGTVPARRGWSADALSMLRRL